MHMQMSTSIHTLLPHAHQGDASETRGPSRCSASAVGFSATPQPDRQGDATDTRREALSPRALPPPGREGKGEWRGLERGWQGKLQWKALRPPETFRGEEGYGRPSALPRSGRGTAHPPQVRRSWCPDIDLRGLATACRGGLGDATAAAGKVCTDARTHALHHSLLPFLPPPPIQFSPSLPPSLVPAVLPPPFPSLFSLPFFCLSRRCGGTEGSLAWHCLSRCIVLICCLAIDFKEFARERMLLTTENHCFIKSVLEVFGVSLVRV